MFPQIDWSKKKIKPRLQLCKNDLNRTVIGNLSESYNVTQKITIGNINELYFHLPYELARTQGLIQNENIEKIKERRIVKFIKGDYTEYYIIHKVSDVMDENTDYKKVECYSLGYELRDKKIKDYSVTSKNATEVLADLLSESIWSIDYIDSSFNIKYRSFDISSSVLDAIQQVAETFNAVIVYDTVNRRISFYDIDNIGQNRGFKVKYGKLLKNITYESDSADYCTRLKVFGRSGLSIQSVNPTGSNFLEDYSSILYGFQRDIHGNVLSHAQDISDDLANAILDYQELVEGSKAAFSSLLSQKETLQSNLVTNQNSLYNLQNELAIIEDQLSVANATGGNTSGIKAQKTAKQSQINGQQSVINGITSNIASVDSQIATLRNSLTLENNFSEDQLKEWNPHVVVQEWSNENYTDAKELYDAAKKEFEKRREPHISVNVSIVNLFEIMSEQGNWDKLNLGDIIKIEHNKLNVNITAKIIELNFDYESGEINLTISNVKDILTDEQRFIKNLYRTISSSASYDSSKYALQDTVTTNSEIYQTINNTWDAAAREIKASQNETVEISRKGLRIYDPADSNKMLIAQHGILAMSGDGGNTWKTAIRHDRIVAENIMGILGEFVQLRANQIIVGDEGAKIPDSVISSATYWNSVEGNAQQYVDTQVIELNGSLDSLEDALDQYADDGMITLSEANALKLSLAQVDKESTDVINVATSLGITTEKTNYQNALNTLNTEISIWTSKPSYPTAITVTDRANIKSKFESVQNTKSILINKISSTREANSISYIDTQVDELNGSLDTLEDKINEYADDGMITLAEANALKLSFAQVEKESTDIINVATALNIVIEKTNYQNALDSLHSEILFWVNRPEYPAIITVTDRNNINTKFESVQNTKSILINKISSTREANSKSYVDTQVLELNGSLDTLEDKIDEYADDGMISLAESNALKISLVQVMNESTDVINVASSLGITSEKANYQTALNALNIEISAWTTKASYPASISPSERASIRAKFESVQNTKSILINKISATREANSISYIDLQVFELNGSLDTLEGKIDEYADDGMISYPEAQALAIALTQVNQESNDIVNVATALGISTEKTNYQNALSILNTEIVMWTTRPIYPAAISLTDRTNINNKFADVQDKKSKLINKIGSARKDEAIAHSDVNLQAAKVYSDTNLITANTYSNTINSAIRNDLRLQAALPTSIKLDSNGITASTTDVNKFARLDYRGLYVQNGAIQITSTDGTTVIDGEGVTASKIKAGDMFGVNLTIGSGNAVFKANSSGISLGNATFANAPFKVDMNGNLNASQASISGAINCTSLSINGTSILAGNKISGNYIDSITTGQITVTSQWGDSAIASAGNWNARTTRLTPDGIYTGTLTANQINAIQGITLGANATIDWNYVNADPKIATAQNTANNASNAASSAQGTANGAFNTATAIANGTYGGGTFISGTTIYSPNIYGGQITSDTTINVGTNATIGNNISVGESLIFRAESITGGIRWGPTGVPAAQIYSQPVSRSLYLYTPNPGAGIYANGRRIDVAPVAVFG